MKDKLIATFTLTSFLGVLMFGGLLLIGFMAIIIPAALIYFFFSGRDDYL